MLPTMVCEAAACERARSTVGDNQMKNLGAIAQLTVALVLCVGCSDTTFSVNNSAPGAAILSPEDGYSTSVGEEISFRGQVTDRATASVELTVVWSSSRDGTLLEGNADSSGITQFLRSDLTEGGHTITLRVVDGDGSSDTDQVLITVGLPGDDDDSAVGDDDDTVVSDDDDSAVGDDDDSAVGDDDDTVGDDDDSTPPPANNPPSAPGVSIAPSSPGITDSLECSISVASIDPESDPVSYDFAFTVGGSPTAHTLVGGSLSSTLTVPSVDTANGQQWTCTVTPHDGYQYGASGSDVVTVTGPCTDLNGDCIPDLVFSNSWDGTYYEVDSYVYYGISGVAGIDYSTSQRTELPTMGSKGNVIADLDNDGYPDIVFANERDDSPGSLTSTDCINHGTNCGPIYNIDSYIYWGSPSGYSVSDRTGLPTVGSRAVDAGDINNDGYLDLVFANTSDGSNHIIASYIYYGSATGFSTSNYDALTTIGAHDVKLAHLNGDSYLDLAVATFRSGLNYELNSYVFWGSSGGFNVNNRVEVPTEGATGVDVGDLDSDGYVDLVFSNSCNNGTCSDPTLVTEQTCTTAGETWTRDLGPGNCYINSYIYWNSGSSPFFSETDRMLLPTQGSWGVSVGDVNSDSDLDIVFANRFIYGSGYEINSFVYRGDPNGDYSLQSRDVLPTAGAWASAIGYLDRDGEVDIVFANRRAGSSTLVDSYVYWGAAANFSASSPVTALPTIGAADVSISGL